MKRTVTHDLSIKGTPVQVDSQNGKVWVNAMATPMCLGRFGPFGLEVNHGPESYVVAALDGVHLKHWLTFKRKMLDIHGVHVSDIHAPATVLKETEQQ